MNLDSAPGNIVKKAMLSFGRVTIPPLQSATISTSEEHSGAENTTAARMYTIDENDLVCYLFAGHEYGMREGFHLEADTPLVLQSPSHDLIENWTEPGDVDLLEFKWHDKFQLDLNLTAAFEIKRVLVNAEGKLKGNPYGTTQASGLVKMGFRRVTLVHLILQEPRYGSDGKSFLQTTGPNLNCFERIKNKPEIKALRELGVHFAMIGLGQHPESSFLSSVEFVYDFIEAHPITDTPEIIANRSNLELGLVSLVQKLHRNKMQPLPTL